MARFGQGPEDRNEMWSDEEEFFLRKRMAESETGARLGEPTELLRGMSRAVLLIFNEGMHDEGVYTLQGRQTPASYVLAFERVEEAERFAEMLVAEGFDQARAVDWHADRITEFCLASDFELGLVPTGTLLKPPETNSYDVDAYNELEKKFSEGEIDFHFAVDPKDQAPCVVEEACSLEYTDTIRKFENLFDL